MSVLRRPLAHDIRRSRHVAAVPDAHPSGPAARDGAVLSAARVRVRRSASSCSCRSSCRREEIFTEYAYFSSYSSELGRARAPLRRPMVERFGLGPRSQVMEIASNDGYLLQHFVARGVPVLGIEPAANVAKVAVEKGIPTTVRFFGRQTRGADRGRARQGRPAARQQRARARAGPQRLRRRHEAAAGPGRRHHDGVSAPAAADGGRTSSTRSTTSTSATCRSSRSRRIFAHHGITLFDVEELPTHGGSLRIYGRHAENAALPVGERVERCGSGRSTTASSRWSVTAVSASR